MKESIQIRLPKHDYSESVVRKALYWASEIGEWQLEHDGNDWIITLDSDSEGVTDLHRILNDFILREKLDAKTADLRDDVIRAAMTRLASGGK